MEDWFCSSNLSTINGSIVVNAINISKLRQLEIFKYDQKMFVNHDGSLYIARNEYMWKNVADIVMSVAALVANMIVMVRICQSTYWRAR